MRSLVVRHAYWNLAAATILVAIGCSEIDVIDASAKIAALPLCAHLGGHRPDAFSVRTRVTAARPENGFILMNAGDGDRDRADNGCYALYRF